MRVRDKTLAHRRVPKAYKRLYVDVWPPGIGGMSCVTEHRRLSIVRETWRSKS